MMETAADHEFPCGGDAVAPFVEGRSIHSRARDFVEVVNPSNGQALPAIPAGCQEDVDGAVGAARRAFDDGRWSDAPPSFRKLTLQRWGDLIAAQAPLLDALDAEEMGKPVAEGFCNAAGAASLTRYYAEAIDKVTSESYASDKYSFVAQRRVPRGVVAAVVPWNFPTFNAVLKVAPALAAGNCVVVKPSEMSSRSALRLAHLAAEAGLPPGVLNVVPGLGEVVGRALGLHPDVDMVAFTGSTEVGRLMLQYAGQSNMKVVTAECGGKSPQIVFDDGVDLDAAAQTIARGLLTNQGQVCSFGSRLLVQKSIEKTMLERIVARVQSVAIGAAVDPQTAFGPLASARQCSRVMQYIAGARGDGAELVAGGGRALRGSGGFFVEPTVFRAPPTARIAQEEIFGPVLCVTSFDDESEALRIANGTMYGLMAYVWSASLSTSLRMARGIRSSAIVNAVAPVGEGPGHAFSAEPAGQSGLGSEGGLAGMDGYMRRQLVWINHG